MNGTGDIVLDSIVRLSRKGTSSTWKSEKGTYRFMKLPTDDGPNKPQRRIYLNRRYLTGIFPTKEKDVFSGDIRMANGSLRRILLQVVGEDRVVIRMLPGEDGPRTRQNALGRIGKSKT